MGHTEEVNAQNIQLIQLGLHRIKPWFFSPYPRELCDADCIYLCDFCLKPLKSAFLLARHMSKCDCNSPPGKKIYQKDNLSFYEFDGKEYVMYAQNLCLLSKLFLDHKTLYYDIEPFFFYVLTETRDTGDHIVGYFSKEKHSPDDYNVACILVLPSYQKLGYGRLLIEFSYELSKLEGRTGSPEKPLSELGSLSYNAYWHSTIVETIMKRIEAMDPDYEENINNRGEVKTEITISLMDLCKITSIKKEDIIATLQLKEVYVYKHGDNSIQLTGEMIDSYRQRLNRKVQLQIDPSLIKWRPPVKK